MPSNYQSKSLKVEQERLTAAEIARWHDLTILVRRYEVLRLIRGPERDEAERALGEALSREERPFTLDGWIWSWSRSELSVLRQKAMMPQPMTKHAR